MASNSVQTPPLHDATDDEPEPLNHTHPQAPNTDRKLARSSVKTGQTRQQSDACQIPRRMDATTVASLETRSRSSFFSEASLLDLATWRCISTGTLSRASGGTSTVSTLSGPQEESFQVWEPGAASPQEHRLVSLEAPRRSSREEFLGLGTWRFHHHKNIVSCLWRHLDSLLHCQHTFT